MSRCARASLFALGLTLSLCVCSQALHGRAKFNERRKRYDKALEDLITIIASYPYAHAPSGRSILGLYR